MLPIAVLFILMKTTVIHNASVGALYADQKRKYYHLIEASVEPSNKRENKKLSPNYESPPGSDGFLIEGDMFLDRQQIEWLGQALVNGTLYGVTVLQNGHNSKFHKNATKHAAILIDKRYLWPNGIVYYDFDETVNPQQKELIKSSLVTLQRKLLECVKFQQRNWGKRVVVTSQTNHCSSAVGMQQKETQKLELSNFGCMEQGKIEHEFLHAIGIYHTQSRWDRDKYVKIIWDNINYENISHNFNIYDDYGIRRHGLPYDYSSIMHYGSTAFGEGKTTIRTLDPNKQGRLGKFNRGVSQGDIKLVQRMYRCKEGWQDNSVDIDSYEEWRDSAFDDNSDEGWQGNDYDNNGNDYDNDGNERFHYNNSNKGRHNNDNNEGWNDNESNEGWHDKESNEGWNDKDNNEIWYDKDSNGSQYDNDGNEGWYDTESNNEKNRGWHDIPFGNESNHIIFHGNDSNAGGYDIPNANGINEGWHDIPFKNKSNESWPIIPNGNDSNYSSDDILKDHNNNEGWHEIHFGNDSKKGLDGQSRSRELEYEGAISKQKNGNRNQNVDGHQLPKQSNGNRIQNSVRHQPLKQMNRKLYHKLNIVSLSIDEDGNVIEF